jgi:hypothetical protein
VTPRVMLRKRAAEDMPEPEVPLEGGSHSTVVRVGMTVRRGSRPWSSAVLDLLEHVHREGFVGAPRALGFDDQGREVLSYVEGEVGSGESFIPLQGGRFDRRLPDYVWTDSALQHLGALIRAYHDAAATFPWAGREWAFEPRSPVETVCHNELLPWNTIFRSGLPVAFIDWDTAAPGPRIWDLGLAAWRWVPFSRDQKCRAIGLQPGIREKARRFRLLLTAYGLEPDIAIVQTAMERAREVLEHLRRLACDGSQWEVELARRGVIDELELEIQWIAAHAALLAS